MAKKTKQDKPKDKPTLHERIEAETADQFDRIGRVRQETSNDGRFSEYRRADDGVTVIQYRDAPKGKP